ncbi:MAG: glycosyltransferase family 4 protein [Anaerolineae bacterium]|nr:glycosyltransferase family 4 protein [Anaerolineae bacterium]
MRLLIATPRAFPYMGGVENHVYQVSRRLAQAGVSVTIVSTDTDGHLPKTETIDGVNMIRVRSHPRRSDWYFSPEVYRVARNGDAQGRKWDLVHIQNYLTFTSPLAMAGARARGCAVCRHLSRRWAPL